MALRWGYAPRQQPAGAESNPPVIKKAQVDAELMRLTRQRSAHSEEQYRIRSERRRAEEDAVSTNRRLDHLRKDLAVREDTSGDRFSIDLGGERITNRGIAGELILRRAEMLKDRTLQEIPIGRFAGFSIAIRVGFDGSPELLVRGQNTYSAQVTDTAQGTIRSLEATAQGMDEYRCRLECEVTNLRKRVGERIGLPFEHERSATRTFANASRQSQINWT